MNAEASLRITPDPGHLAATARLGHRRIGSERGMRMSVPCAIGTAVFVVLGWAIWTLLLRWLTLD